MEHKGTRPLETARLLLRPFVLEDADAMYRNWASDPAVTTFLMWPPHESREVSRRVLEEWVGRYEEPAFYQWAIVLKEIGQPIGSISVNNSIDDTIKMAHMGYCLGRKWWHRGITSEALARVIRYLLDEVGLNRIESRHDPRNPNSGAVMKKCGMKYEGTLRQSDWNNQGVCDASYYALLAEED